MPEPECRDPEVGLADLAHGCIRHRLRSEREPVEAAYARSDLFERRRPACRCLRYCGRPSPRLAFGCLVLTAGAGGRSAQGAVGRGRSRGRRVNEVRSTLAYSDNARGPVCPGFRLISSFNLLPGLKYGTCLGGTSTASLVWRGHVC